MCNCLTWARLPEQGTHGGKYPPPAHHPNCEDFKAERFVRVMYDGIWCVMEVDDAADLIAESEEKYATEDVFLTSDQFERMEEFSGF